MFRLVPSALRVSAVAAAALLALTTVSVAAPPDARGLTGPAHEMSLAAEDTWMVARKTARSQDRADEAVTQRLFAYAGAARLAAEHLSRHATTPAEASRFVSDLDSLAASAQDAMELARSPLEVRAALRDARASLMKLRDVVAGVAGPAPVAAPAAPAAPPAPPPTTAPAPPASTSQLEPPKVDPNAPTAAFDSVAWKRTLRPDLVVECRIEGRGLVRGELQVRDASGKVLLSQSQAFTDAIQARATGQPKDALSSVVVRHVFGNDEMPSGGSTLVLLVEDSRGRKGEATSAVEKRGLF